MDNILVLSTEVITKVVMSLVTETIINKDKFLKEQESLDAIFVRSTNSSVSGHTWQHQVFNSNPPEYKEITDQALLNELETKWLKYRYSK